MKKKKNNLNKPEWDISFPKWQKGNYDRRAKLEYPFSQGFLSICKLAGVTPSKVISDFTDNFGSGGQKGKDRGDAQTKVMEYFLAIGYGQDMYAPDDIALMFKELDAVHLLWPDGAKMKFIMKHAKWRQQYERHWFKKWYNKPRRRVKTPYYQ